MTAKADGSTQTVVAILPLELANRLDAQCVKLERARSWMIRKAIEAWVERLEKASQ